jgi:hypothetical protein
MLIYFVIGLVLASVVHLKGSRALRKLNSTLGEDKFKLTRNMQLYRYGLFAALLFAYPAIALYWVYIIIQGMRVLKRAK